MARRTRQKQRNEQRWTLNRHVFHSTLQSICSFLTLDKLSRRYTHNLLDLCNGVSTRALSRSRHPRCYKVSFLTRFEESRLTHLRSPVPICRC
jgi:hypothetical protein